MPDETDLLAAQMRSLAAIAPGVAHDLRGPVNTIVFTLELLREAASRVADPALRDRQLGYVEVLAKEAARLHRGLETFIAHAATPPGRRQVVSLSGLAAELADMAAGPLRQRRLGLERQIAAERLEVEADGPGLRQALLQVFLAALAESPPQAGLTLGAFAQDNRAVVEIGPAAGAPGAEAGRHLATARALLETIGGTLIAGSNGPAGTPGKHRVELPLSREGTA
jgi:signal transduction histidine kinase